MTTEDRHLYVAGVPWQATAAAHGEDRREGRKERREGGDGDEGMWTFGRPFIRVSGRTTH
jgi:hypothetical protein